MASFPISQKIGSPTTLVSTKGGFKADVGTIITSYSNLAAANANTYLSSYAGADIVIADDNRYYRNQAASAWILHFTSTNFSVTNASPLFTASIVNPTTSPTLTFALSNVAVGTVLNNSGGSAGVPGFVTDVVLGETGVTAGSLTIRSVTAGGAPIIRSVGSFGNYFLNLPLNAGTLGQALLSGGGGTTPMSWGTVLTGITANNGLTASTATNVQLGGTLIQNTTINTSSFYLNITTSTAGVVPLIATAGTGLAFNAQNSAPSGRIAEFSNLSTGGSGIKVQALGGTLLELVSTTACLALDVTCKTASDSGLQTMAHWQLDPISAGASGVGIKHEYWITTNGGAAEENTNLIFRWPILPTKVSEFTVRGSYASTSLQDVFSVRGNGNTQLTKYGVGTFAAASTYLLGVDASGNIVETSPVGSGTANLYTPTLTNAANVSSSTAFQCQYSAMVDASTGYTVVTVSGKFGITFTTSGVSTRLGISLPIASAMTADQQVGGVAASNGSVSGNSFAVRADTTNDRAEFYATAPGSSLTDTYWFSFTYVVITG